MRIRDWSSDVCSSDLTVDRYLARHLADRIGGEFAGRINVVTRFGVFVTLAATGADGLVPIRSLPDDYYDHDDARHRLTGRFHGRVYRLGRSEEDTSELQSLLRRSYADLCLQQKKIKRT